ncbi:MAG: flagellar biosynthetic protein FliO [Myxococcota bacterium]
MTRLGVIAVAVFAMTLTGATAAATEAVGPPLPPATASAEAVADARDLPPDEALLTAPLATSARALNLREATPPTASPLALAPATTPASDAGWKLLGVALLLGALAIGLRIWRRRRGGLPLGRASAPPALDVLARAPLAQRGELLVVRVDEQRLLLGVTAQRIVRLAQLEPEGGRSQEGLVPTDAPPAVDPLADPAVDFERLLEAVAAAEPMAKGDGAPSNARARTGSEPSGKPSGKPSGESSGPGPSSPPPPRLVSVGGGAQARSLATLRRTR